MKAFFITLKRTLLISSKSQNTKGVWERLFGIMMAAFLVQVTLGVLSGYQTAILDAMINFSGHAIVQSSQPEWGITERRDFDKFMQQKYPQAAYIYYAYHETLMPTASGFKPVVFKLLAHNQEFVLNRDAIKKVYPIQFTGDFGGLLTGDKLAKNAAGVNSQLQFVNKNAGKSLLQSLTVSGTFESGYYDFDSRFVFAPISLWTKITGEDAKIEGAELRFKNLHDLTRFIKDVEQHFYERLLVVPYHDLNANLIQALTLERQMVWLVVVLVISIASLNLFGHVFAYGIAYRHEINILAMLGASSRWLKALLAAGGWLSGMLAVAAGSFVAAILLWWLQYGSGVTLDATVYFLERLPAKFEANWFGGAIAAFALLAAASTLFAGKTVIRPHKEAIMMRQ